MTPSYDVASTLRRALRGGSCFVANCLQLVGAVRSGVAHITMARRRWLFGAF